MDSDQRNELGDLLNKAASKTDDSTDGVIGLEVRCAARAPDFWEAWESRVPLTEEADLNSVVPTADTARHEALVEALCRRRSGSLLCGPPGSGKTMTCDHALASNRVHAERLCMCCRQGFGRGSAVGTPSITKRRSQRIWKYQRRLYMVIEKSCGVLRRSTWSSPTRTARRGLRAAIDSRKGFWALSTIRPEPRSSRGGARRFATMFSKVGVAGTRGVGCVQSPAVWI